jgi:hypothetical protein
MKIFIDGRLAVKCLAVRLLGVALLFGLFMPRQQESAFAQAGSTGGFIGKTDKSISGEGAAEPNTPAKSRSRSQRAIDRGSSDQPSDVSAAGRWRWTADCPARSWQGEFDLAETSRGQFGGSFSGTSWYDAGTITDGRVNGGSVSFTRKVAWVTQYWKGRLAAGHIKGTLSGNDNCNWEATRK